MNFLSKLPTPGRSNLLSPKSINSQNFVKQLNFATRNSKFNNVVRFNATQTRTFSKSPVVRNEGAPVVLNVEPEEKSDLVERTEWVYGFSSILLTLGVGIGLLLSTLFNNDDEERNKTIEESDEIIEGLQFLRILPWKLMSNYVSEKAKEPWKSREDIRWYLERYMRIYNVNPLPIEKQYWEFKNFEEFFTRTYHPEYIKMAFERGNSVGPDAICSPVEGTIVSLQKITNENHKEYIKEEWYSAKQFLGYNPFDEANHIKNERVELIENTLNEKLTQIPKKDMYMCVIYLGPGNYHRFHSPVDWSLKKRKYFPGNLYPVKSSYLNFFKYKSLLGENERVVLSGEWRHGLFSFIPVGATNVGSIHLTPEPEFDNSKIEKEEFRDYEQSMNIKQGDEIGFFSLGSTVVLVFEYANGRASVFPGQKVLLGDALLVKQDDYLVPQSESD